MWNWRPAVLLLMCLFLFATISVTTGKSDAPGVSDKKDSTSWLSSDDSSNTLYKIEKKNKNNLLQLKGTATDRKYTGTELGSFGLEALFGHLFAPIQNQYMGYYFLSGKLRNDNNQRFTATLGYFPPLIGGETKLTYRALRGEVRQDMQGTGEFEESALEQGVALYYKKYYNLFLRELSLNYAFTYMGEESDVTGPLTFDTTEIWRQSRAIRGFGDTETHNGLAEIAIGSDALEFPLLEGLRLDLGGGYEKVRYGEFYDISEVTDEGFSAIARLQLCTPAGVLMGSYQDAQSGRTTHGSYKLGGLELYYTNIEYARSDTLEIFGLALTFDIFNPGSFVDFTCRPFFHPTKTNYSSIYQMSHINDLASDEFIVQKVNQVYEDIYQVNKTQIPDNVRIDTSGSDPKLVVTATCPLVNILSVVPSNAFGAFSVNGNELYVSLAALPGRNQTVVARINDRCCGDTQVQLVTRAGSVAVDYVDVRERVGCVPPTAVLLPNGDPCTADTECQAGLCSANGTCGGENTTDACTLDSECKSNLCGSTGTCGGDTNDICAADNECKIALCGSSGTCGGDTNDICSINNECKINVCGSSGTCGGDNSDACILDNECKAALCGSSSTCGGDYGDICTVNSECKSSNCVPTSTPPSPLQCF